MTSTFTKPLFARGGQLITLLAEAREAGYFCVKLEVLGNAKYRCHFMKDFPAEKKSENKSCVDVELQIQSPQR